MKLKIKVEGYKPITIELIPDEPVGPRKQYAPKSVRDERALRIWKLHKQGISMRSIASDEGISQEYVRQIIRRQEQKEK